MRKALLIMALAITMAGCASAPRYDANRPKGKCEYKLELAKSGFVACLTKNTYPTPYCGVITVLVTQRGGDGQETPVKLVACSDDQECTPVGVESSSVATGDCDAFEMAPPST